MALTNNIKALITLITTINPIWTPPHESYKDMYYEQKIVEPEKTIGIKKNYMKNCYLQKKTQFQQNTLKS